MQYELAPMEGITGYVYRNAYIRYFGGMERYYTPFIASTGLNHKELNDVVPEHNAAFVLGLEQEVGQERRRPRLIPQILTNRAEDFLIIADRLGQMGYSHVNLNLGCPAGTVASRGRGAGFLQYPERLDSFLSEIYGNCALNISIKTRIGVTDTAQWEELLCIYAKYPVEELIIHPRIQQDFYRHAIRWEGLEAALEHWERTGCEIPLCYNGEIHSIAEYRNFRRRFPQINRIMLGRGVLKDPFLAGRLRHWESGRQVSGDMGEDFVCGRRRELLPAFHQELLEGYGIIMSGDRNTLFKMKELWTYFGESFSGKDKALKKIRKAGNMAQYEAAVREVFSC